VPESVPLVALKTAHAGRFVMLKVSGSPSASDAVGRNEYDLPTVATFPGAPEIVGGLLPEDTAIENAGSAVVTWPSFTLIAMFEWVRLSEDGGVPYSLPVKRLKLAHAGLLAMLKLSVSPSESEAVGRKE
jgi:hypothetical protein